MNIPWGLGLHVSALQTLAPARSSRACAPQEPQHSQQSQLAGHQTMLSTHLGKAPLFSVSLAPGAAEQLLQAPGGEALSKI